jgi:hypothetical protein
VEGELHYNVDARRKPRFEPDISKEQALALLRHRCSTTVDLGDDQWPWDHHHVEPGPG